MGAGIGAKGRLREADDLCVVARRHGDGLNCEGESDASLKYEKGLWWMPRHHQTKKDAASSENLGKAQTACDPGVSEWGNPAGSPVDL